MDVRGANVAHGRAELQMDVFSARALLFIGSDGSFNLTHRPPRAPIKADWDVRREGGYVRARARCVLEWNHLNAMECLWANLTIVMFLCACVFTVAETFADL